MLILIQKATIQKERRVVTMQNSDNARLSYINHCILITIKAIKSQMNTEL